MSDETRLCPKCGQERRQRKSGNGYQAYRCYPCDRARQKELHPRQGEHTVKLAPRVKRERPPRQPVTCTLPDHIILPDVWRACVHSFLTSVYERSRAESTLLHYRAILTDFFTACPGQAPDAISRAQVEAYLHSPGRANGRVGKPVKASTRNNRLAALRAFYKHSSTYAIIDEGGIPQPLLRRLSPVAGISVVEREDPPKRSLSEEELAQFFAQCDTSTALGARDKALFLCLFLCGRRRSELCGLRYGQIQPAMIVEPGGKRRAGWIYHFPRAKSHKGEDSAELLPLCKAAIDHYILVSGRKDTIQAEDAIWITDRAYHGQQGYDEHRPLSPVTVWHICKRIAKRAGLSPDICVHSFRHASAQHRYLQGEDIFSISSLLRHSSLDMTKIYLDGLCSTADVGASMMEARFAHL